MLYSKFQWYRPLGSEDDNFIGFLPYIGLWPDHLNKLASVKSSIRTSTNQKDGSQTTANDLNVYEPHQNLDRRLCTSKTGLSLQKFITDRSKAVLLLWFILIVNVCPLYACLWLSFHFIKDNLAAICWESVVPLAFWSCGFYFMPSQLYVFLSR